MCAWMDGWMGVGCLTGGRISAAICFADSTKTGSIFLAVREILL